MFHSARRNDGGFCSFQKRLTHCQSFVFSPLQPIVYIIFNTSITLQQPDRSWHPQNKKGQSPFFHSDLAFFIFITFKPPINDSLLSYFHLFFWVDIYSGKTSFLFPLSP
jgi:hypothetical protein